MAGSTTSLLLHLHVACNKHLFVKEKDPQCCLAVKNITALCNGLAASSLPQCCLTIKNIIPVYNGLGASKLPQCCLAVKNITTLGNDLAASNLPQCCLAVKNITTLCKAPVTPSRFGVTTDPGRKNLELV